MINVPRWFKEKTDWPVILIAVAVVLVAAFNYQPGTFLSGWDNLHPEFNFPLNLRRSFFSVWQEYQGLGLLPGMGHAADFFRQLFLWLTSLVLPVSFLRYFFHFLMLFLGPLGIYFLLKNFILEGKELGERRVGGLSAAFFYLFNLATLQLFYVPYEAFSLHFAALPWLFLVSLNYPKNPSKRSLFWLLAVNLLAVAQGYVATFLVVYLAGLALVFFLYWWSDKRIWPKIFFTYLLVFLVNAFWLLPNLYFALTNVEVTMKAKINLMATEENFLRNKKYGDLASVVLLKGFWFDNVEPNKEGQVEPMMIDWESYLEKPIVKTVGFLIFLLALAGAAVAVWKKSVARLFLPVFLLGFLMLLNDTPVLSLPTTILYRSSLFSQLFRFPFTKFSTLTAFGLAIFYSLSLLAARQLNFKARWRAKLYRGGVLLFFLGLPVFLVWPVFQGKLFYRKERTIFPLEYFQLFDFFRNQEESGRIANFPQTNFWGWNFYHWPGGDYSGSGFLWYGIGQPILDRAFDPWGKANENYYWEVSYALYSQNQLLFEKVLDKYQVTWVLVDESSANGGSWQALGLEGLDRFLSSSKFSLAAQFGKIKVFRVNQSPSPESFVFWAESLPNIGPAYDWGNFDRAFWEHGYYLSLSTAPIDYYYPFRSLFSGRELSERDFEIEDRGEYFLFRREIPGAVSSYFLQIPQFNGEELVWVDAKDLSQSRILIPEVRHYDNELVVFVPKVDGYFSAALEAASAFSLSVAQNCTQFKNGTISGELVSWEGKKTWRLSAVDANNCSASFPLPSLPHKFGYLLSVKSRNLEGRNLLFWLENLTNQKVDLELFLDKKSTSAFLIQPPMAKDGLGYSLHFDNISIGRQKTVNDLQAVTVNPLPYDFLTGLCLTQQKLPVSTAALTPLKADHPNPTLYEVTEPKKEGIIVLSQAYHPGWHAYAVSSKFNPSIKLRTRIQSSKLMSFLAPLLGKEIKDHVLVNNWENGWRLNKEQGAENKEESIYLIFLPQYLEYLGFGLLGLAPILLLSKAKN
jgi:hypothetical protein